MRLLPATVLLGLAVVVLPGSVAAHSYKSVGTVSVLYHAEPSDQPAALQKSSLNFFITDKSNTFALADCYCRALIRDIAGREVIVPLMIEGVAGTPSQARARTPFTFKQEGTYTVELLGTSKRLKGFPSFKTSFVQRVSAAPVGAGLFGGISQGWIIFILSLCLLAVATLAVWGRHHAKPAQAHSAGSDRFANPFLHYGFYALLAGVAILTLFGYSVYNHHIR